MTASPGSYLCLLGACILTLAAAQPPHLSLTFAATMHKSEFAPWTQWQEQRSMEQVVSDEKILGFKALVKFQDGRFIPSLFRYRETDPLKGQYQVQPFFEETVCYIFDLPKWSPPISGNESWRFTVFDTIIGAPEHVLNDAEKGGMASVDNKPCQIYTAFQQKGTVENISYTICIGLDGELLAVNSTTSFSWLNRSAFSARTFWNSSAKVDPALLMPPQKGCVNLTTGTREQLSDEDLINQPSRILALEKAASGSWHAGLNSVFEGVTLGRAKKDKMGTRIGALRLPLKSRASDIVAPLDFDARNKWSHCLSIRRIRNQGSCGSCWAFAASEVLADRVCIGGGASNLTLSPEYLVDCARNETGCDGGLLDDAWYFLVTSGVPEERCDPYQYCPYPESQNCKKPNSSASPHSSRSCPSHCTDGMALRRVQAHSAYAVARPGDALAMQQEIASEGPIEVAFFVFLDFMNYRNGTYFRVRIDDTQLVGAHAVRVLGWGNDERDVKYWLAANSWGPEWGMRGFFHIRRGTNECGFESTPAAGQYQVLANDAIVI